MEEKLAAKIGTVGYASLSAALANVTKDAPLTWVDDEVWPDDTPVYYNGTFYATMAAAIEAVKNESANVDPNIYCKPNTTIPGGVAHSSLTTSVTFFGNNATLNGNSEMDLGSYFTQEKDVTYKFYNLKKCGIWGTKNSDYTTTIEMANCQDVHEYLVQYNSGNGVVNGTISNCTFIYGNGYAAHMSGISQDCGGTLNISGCTFTNMPCGANIKNDAGNLAVTITDCEFIDCGNTTSASAAGASTFAAAVRRGAKTKASGSFTMTGCTFTYSSGVEKALDTDIVIGENRTNNGEGVITYNISNTAASVKVYQVHASGVAATLKSEMTLKTSDVAVGNNE